jgi:predicted GNAT family N-acyltransferase
MNLLFVHPAQQKTGIGQALLDSALETCRQIGKSRQITLNSSSYAAPFYLKYGFAPNGEPKDKPGGCIPLIINL